MLFERDVNSPSAAGVMRTLRASSPLPTVSVGTSPPSRPGTRAVTVTGCAFADLDRTGRDVDQQPRGKQVRNRDRRRRGSPPAQTPRSRQPGRRVADRRADRGAPHRLAADHALAVRRRRTARDRVAGQPLAQPALPVAALLDRGDDHVVEAAGPLFDEARDLPIGRRLPQRQTARGERDQPRPRRPTRTTKTRGMPSEASSQTASRPTQEHRGGGRSRRASTRAGARAASSASGRRRGSPRARSDARPPSCLSYAIRSPAARPNLRPPAPPTSPAARSATSRCSILGLARVRDRIGARWCASPAAPPRGTRPCEIGAGFDSCASTFTATLRSAPDASGMAKMPGTGPSPGGVAGSTHDCVSRRPSVR